MYVVNLIQIDENMYIFRNIDRLRIKKKKIYKYCTCLFPSGAHFYALVSAILAV